MPAEDVTIKATWTVNQYTITFDTNGGNEIAQVEYDYGSAITAPADPVKNGYSFAGWSPTIPETMPAQDLTVTAQWTVNQYTITFNTDGGTAIDPITQNYGTVVTAPAAPTKTGYTFAGWDNEIPTTMPAEDVTIKATWTVNQYTITFDTDGGNEIAQAEYDYGSVITAPTDPVKNGYSFAGWIPALPATMPAENLEVTAQWTINRYAITVLADAHGSANLTGIGEDGKAEFNSEVTATATPANEDYVFDYWTDDAGNRYTLNPYTFLATRDVALTVHFKLSFDPVAKIEDVYYRTLTDAVTAANAAANDGNVEQKIVVLKDIEQTEDLILDSGVTLLLPYAPGEAAERINGDYTGDPETDLFFHPYSNENIVGTTANITPVGEQVTYKLTMNGSTLTLSDGAMLAVGGTLSGNHPITGGTYGPHSEIEMTNGGSIQVENGAILSNCGYITGGTVNANGTVYEPFVMTDFHGGGVLANRLSSGTTPFNSFALINIQSDLVLHADASLRGYAMVNSGSTQFCASALTIGNVDDDEGNSSTGLFVLDDDTIMTISYDANNPVDTYGVPIGKTTFTVDGNITFTPMTISLLGQTLSTESVTFGIPYNIDMVQKTGCFTIGSNAAILPGSSISVEKNASAIVKNGYELIVLDSFDPKPEGGQPTYPNSQRNLRGNLFIDGELTIESGATFGGAVQTHGTGKVTLEKGVKRADLVGSFRAGGGENVTTHSATATMAMLTKNGNSLRSMSDALLASENTTYYAVSGEQVTVSGKTSVQGTWGYDTTIELYGNDAIEADQEITVRIGKPFTLPADAYTRTGYMFAGWNTKKSGTGTSYDAGTYDMTVDTPDVFYAQWEIKRYTITFDTAGGSEITPIEQDYGTTVIPPANPTKEGYTFDGWDQEIPATMPAEDITITAKWKINQYTITFNTDGGTEIAAVTQDYGSDVTAPANPTKTGYTFKGWKDAAGEDATIPATMPAKNVTLTAKWEINKYTITFDTDGGIAITPITQNYGTEVTAPEDPTKEGYTFKGWKDAAGEDATIPATMPAENVTLTAKWEINQYTIRFVDEDGESILQSSLVEHGKMPAYAGDEPTKASTAEETFTFAGWTPTIVSATAPATYTATYTSAPREYTITWVDGNGQTLKEDQVAYYDTPAYEGDEPTKNADAQYTYSFNGEWLLQGSDPASGIAPVTGDATYVAQFDGTLNSYTVKFVSEDGEQVLQEETLEYGAAITAPADPTKEETDEQRFVFVGWFDENNVKWTEGTTVTGEVTYKAKFDPEGRLYTVVWLDGDGNELQRTEEPVLYDEIPEYSGITPTKAATAEFDYAFDGSWATEEIEDPDTHITSITYTANFTETTRSYTITWVDGDGNTLKEELLLYGSTPSYSGVTPTKTVEGFTYTFNNTWLLQGSDPESGIVSVTGDATYLAQFDEQRNSYTVTWVIDDSEEEETYQFEAQISHSEPSKTGYSFAGWDPEIPDKMPAQDLTITAKWTINQYTITFNTDGGTEIAAITQDFGTAVTAPADPTKTGYTFAGWDKEIPATMPAENVTITAKWKINQHTIKFLNWNGSVIKTDVYDYGTSATDIVKPEDPTKSTGESEDGAYSFAGWTPELETVTKDAEYTATFAYTGWRADENGKRYYDADEMQTGWLTLDDEKYYLDPETGYAATGVVAIAEGDPGHVFDENGVWLESFTGVFTDGDNMPADKYLVENGVVKTDSGLYRDPVKEEYYFFDNGKALVNQTIEITGANVNGLLLPDDKYTFGPDGVIAHEDVTLDGIQTVGGRMYYYVDGIRVFQGMFKKDGYYYYADRSGKLITGRTYWCARNNDLKPEGSYAFDEDGRMIIVETKNGIYAEEGSLFYYLDGVRTYAGLIEVKEDDNMKYVDANGNESTAAPGYYYVRTSGELVHGRSYWITKTNETGFEENAYSFADDGRMIIVAPKKGIYAEEGSLFYYENGTRTYAGLIEASASNPIKVVDADGNESTAEPGYYYVRTNGEVVHGRSYWITKHNDLLPEKAYRFDADGRLIPDDPQETKNGFYVEDGKKYYYKDGSRYYAGLILVDGDYYYVKTNGEVVCGRSYWITKTNDLEGFTEKAYEFDADGRMIL